MKTSFFKSCFGVFQGGGCRAAALAGAVEEAHANGVHFAEVAGTSAGSIVAALLGAGATAKQVSKSLFELDFPGLLTAPLTPPQKPSFPWTLALALKMAPKGPLKNILLNQGMYSSAKIQDWIEEQLRSLIPGSRSPIKFRNLLIPTWVVAADLRTKKVKVWSTHSTPDDDVSTAVRASCSIPIFFQPVEWRYVDGGALSNLPAFVFEHSISAGSSLSTRILAFSLESPNDEEELSDVRALGKALVSTVIDGSTDLQLMIQRDVHVISIPTGDIKATDFDRMSEERVNFLVEEGRTAVRSFFGQELRHVQPRGAPANVCQGLHEMYTAIVEHLDHQVQEILVAEEDTDWIYALSPAFLHWATHGVTLRVLLRQGGDSETHGAFRRKLLLALGAEIAETSQLPVRAFIFDPTKQDRASAVVGVSKISGSAPIEAVKYSGRYDYSAIVAIRQSLQNFFSGPAKAPVARPRIAPIPTNELFEALKGVPQYDHKDVAFSMESVPIDSMLLLTRYIREYKYLQIKKLIDLYSVSGIELFSPARTVFHNDRSTIITPPVVERVGKTHIVIEGTTRALFMHHNGLKEIKCVVVDGVQEPLPGKLRLALQQVRVIARTLSAEGRYGDFNLDLFRNIEQSVRPPSTTL